MKLSVLSLITLLTISTASIAADDSAFQWSAFISQSLVKTSSGVKLSGDSDKRYGSLARTEIGASASYQLNDHVDFRGMLSMVHDGDIDDKLRVNYGLVDIHDDKGMVGVRVGRYSYDYGYYNSARNNPLYRDMELPPQGLYRDGFRYMTRSGDGIQLYGKHHFNQNYSIDVDAGYGNPVLFPQEDIAQTFVLNKDAGTFESGSRVASLNTTIENREYGCSIKVGYLQMNYKFSTPFIDGGDQFPMKAENFYLGGRKYFSFGDITLEFMQTRMGHTKWDDLNPIPNYVWGGVRGNTITYKHYVTDKVSMIVGYDEWFVNSEDKNGQKMENATGGAVPAGNMYHRSNNFGLIYREKNYALKAEFHMVKGTSTVRAEGNDVMSLKQPTSHNILILSATYKF